MENMQVTMFEAPFGHLYTHSGHMMSKELAEEAQHDDDDDEIHATTGGDVGASGEWPTVSGQIELEPGATPQTQQQGGTPARATTEQGTADDEFGGLLCDKGGTLQWIRRGEGPTN